MYRYRGGASAFLSFGPAAEPIDLLEHLFCIRVILDGTGKLQEPLVRRAGLQPILDGGLEEAPLGADVTGGQSLLAYEAHNVLWREAQIGRGVGQRQHVGRRGERAV